MGKKGIDFPLAEVITYPRACSPHVRGLQWCTLVATLRGMFPFPVTGRVRHCLPNFFLFAAAANCVLCRSLVINLDNYNPVPLLRMTPDVEHRREQHDDSQWYKLGQFVGQSTHAVASDSGVARPEDEETGDSSICQWQYRGNPRTSHAPGHLIWTRHIGIFVAQDQVRGEDEQVRQRGCRDDEAKHQTEKQDNTPITKSCN